MTLREIVAACEKIYCGSYGAEFIHIPDREKCDWLRERIEVPQPFKYSIDEKSRILDRLDLELQLRVASWPPSTPTTSASASRAARPWCPA